MPYDYIVYSGLHEHLADRQSTVELERKAKRAKRRNGWTVEEIDLNRRRRAVLHEGPAVLLLPCGGRGITNGKTSIRST